MKANSLSVHTLLDMSTLLNKQEQKVSSTTDAYDHHSEPIVRSQMHLRGLSMIFVQHSPAINSIHFDR